MCRWLAYSGSPVLLEDLLYKPDHSLIDQSLHARLGVGWYGTNTETPAVFRSVEPARSPRLACGEPLFRGCGPCACSTSASPPYKGR
jgi:predicted glutamine amidotransferase